MLINCIVGTDTAIGKTYACCQIMRHVCLSEQKIATLKPIASGTQEYNGQLINEDVVQLAKFSNYPLSLQQINPLCLQKPVAPHIASALEHKHLSVSDIMNKVHEVIQKEKLLDHVLIEGVGGLMVPLNNKELYLDLLQQFNYNIIMVVGIKLGCLNHALLTYNMLQQSNLHVVGWIANYIDANMLYPAENVQYLIEHLPAPLLGEISFNGELNPTDKFKEIFKCR